MEQFEMDRLAEMSPFTHRGVTYYADDMEHIYDAEGKVLGYICSRGALYGWGAISDPKPGEESGFEFARGTGRWEPMDGSKDEVPDPAMDALLHAHAFRCGVCEGRGKVKADFHSESARVSCSYCNGSGVTGRASIA